MVADEAAPVARTPRAGVWRRWQPWATLAVLAAVTAIATARHEPPRARPAVATAVDFSAERAMRHVAAIAREPHPLGSEAGKAVRAYLVDELKKLGLEPQLQRPRDARDRREDPRVTPDRSDAVNVVARWRGSGPAGKMALLLSAHHDSVVYGPGAGDNASGVAAILETLRALKSGPPPIRDIIVLFEDGEEIGLYGADVFAAEHPWAADVGVAINLDARGHTGPSFMFETSEGNGRLIAEMARALPHPMATSLTYEVYRLMPNDTDLTVYKKYGMAGYNFAFVGGLADYHSPRDTPANLAPATLQHQGENVLAMARRLSGLDLDDVRAPDVVYFSVLQKLVVVYPMSWVRPLLQAAAAMFVGVMALGVWRDRVHLIDMAGGFAALLAAAMASATAVGVLWSLLYVPMVRAEVLVKRPDLAHGKGMLVSAYDRALLTGSATVAVAVTALVFGWSSRRWSLEGMGLGVLGCWLALAAATSIRMPGASYAFVWPLLAILAAQAAAFLMPRDHPAALVLAWIAAVPLLVLHVLIILGLFDGLNVRVAAYLMIPVVPVAGALVPVTAQAMGKTGPGPASP